MEIEWSAVLRLLNFGFAVANLVLVLMFVSYLRTLYDPETRGKDERRFIAARIGTFVLLLYSAVVVFGAIIGLHHTIGTPDWANFSAHLVTFSFQLAIFMLMSSWSILVLEDGYRGRWPRVDNFIERLLRPFNR